MAEIFGSMGYIFMVKGNNVEILDAGALARVTNLEKYIEGDKFILTPGKVQELLNEGYEVAIDDGSEKSSRIRNLIKNTEFMRGGRDFMNFSLDEPMGAKLLKQVKTIGRSSISGLGKVLPSIAGFSTPIGAIASGLLYAGTSKPAGANTAIEPYEGVYATRNILDTPITADNRNLHDQVGVVDTSLGPMDRDSGFDRYMQDKIQNQRNNQGIMGVDANRERTASRVDPQGNIRAYGLKRGGIASLL